MRPGGSESQSWAAPPHPPPRTRDQNQVLREVENGVCSRGKENRAGGGAGSGGVEGCVSDPIDGERAHILGEESKSRDSVEACQRQREQPIQRWPVQPGNMVSEQGFLSRAGGGRALQESLAFTPKWVSVAHIFPSYFRDHPPANRVGCIQNISCSAAGSFAP